MNALIPANPTPQQWAAHIGACWSAGVKAIIETGRLLTAAKAALEHGEFGDMIDTALPFSASTAQRLMAIAGDPRLSNAAHVQHLPPSWGTLYELTKLDDVTFAQKLADGTIRPDSERAEIVSLRKAIRNAPADEAYRARVDAGCTLEDLIALADSGAQFGAITADPNWQYETWSDRGKDRSPDQHYDTDALDAIMALPVPRLAAKNSALHLWCLDCMLPAALQLIDAWGFTFIKVGFNWIKLNPSGDGRFMGLGHWTRDGAELCLFATKGHPVRRSAAVRQVLEAPIGRHSEKPKEIFERVEALTGGPYLELFARETREGWTCWGDEIPRDSFRARLDESHDDRVIAHHGETPKAPPESKQPLSCLDEEFAELEIPDFLRRTDSPAAFPRLAKLADTGERG